MSHICKVTVEDQVREYPSGTMFADVVEDFQAKTPYPIVLVTVNGKLRELHKRVKEDCTLELITTADDIGHKTYKRSVSMLLLKAIYHVAGHDNIESIVLHFTVGTGFYYTIKGSVSINEDFLAKVKAYMETIVEKKVPIMKRSVSTDDAISLFHQYRMYDKEKLFKYRRVSRVNIYSMDDFEDYYYGFMTFDTSYLKHFELYPYDEGFVLQMPVKSEPDVLRPFEPMPKIFKVQQEAERWAEMLEVPTVGDLNERIAHQDTRELVLIAEALQESKIAQIAEQITARDNVKFVMIAGPSSSGKTTFSQRLSIQLSARGLKPKYVGVDNYFKNRSETPVDEDGKKNFDCLEAVDIKQFNDDMTALLEGKEVDMPEFNFKTGVREYKDNYLQLKDDDILVIEGIHCLNDALSASLPKESKFKVYISALTQLNIDEHNRIPTTDGRLIRRMVRDARTRGASARDTISMWPSVRRGEEQYIFPFQESADVMFNSALIYELAVLKIYAEPLLFQIQKEDPEYQEAKRLLKFLDYFVAIPNDDIPHNSILREFIGGGCFHL